MHYVTTTELAKKWNISSRRIALYCEEGRIAGVLKKGMTWLIPENAQKPVDNRKVTRKTTRKTLKIDENIAKMGSLSVYNKLETDNPRTPYYAQGIYENLGLTRDALQYYEKIGLIEPKRNVDNLYREFDFRDFFQLMAIDFYKKRGFSLLKIKNLMKDLVLSDSVAAFQQQEIELEQSIYEQQCILARLKKTREFCENVRPIGEHFEIKELPLFSVLKSFDDARDISNYGGSLINTLDGEDLLSNLIWAISFDNTGYKGQKKCIVKKSVGKRQKSKGQYLESGRCLFTAGLVDEHFAEKIFLPVYTWLNEHGLEAKGIAYTFLRFVTLEEKIGQQFLELWIPLK